MTYSSMPSTATTPGAVSSSRHVPTIWPTQKPRAVHLDGVSLGANLFVLSTREFSLASSDQQQHEEDHLATTDGLTVVWMWYGSRYEATFDTERDAALMREWFAEDNNRGLLV